MKAFEGRKERGQHYTIFTDSTAAIDRARSDNAGPGQRFAIAIIEIRSWALQGNNGLTIRWVPSYLGIEGNEVADRWAKMAAEDILVSRNYSLATVSVLSTGARAKGIAKWIPEHVDPRRRYKPPREARKLRKELRHEQKAYAAVVAAPEA